MPRMSRSFVFAPPATGHFRALAGLWKKKRISAAGLEPEPWPDVSNSGSNSSRERGALSSTRVPGTHGASPRGPRRSFGCWAIPLTATNRKASATTSPPGRPRLVRLHGPSPAPARQPHRSLPRGEGEQCAALLCGLREISLSRPVARCCIRACPVVCGAAGDGLFMVGATMIESDQVPAHQWARFPSMLEPACRGPPTALPSAFGEAEIVEKSAPASPAARVCRQKTCRVLRRHAERRLYVKRLVSATAPSLPAPRHFRPPPVPRTVTVAQEVIFPEVMDENSSLQLPAWRENVARRAVPAGWLRKKGSSAYGARGRG